MKNFIDIANRLKLVLKLDKDGDIAEFLEMSQPAFAGRKKRNSFPEEQLRLIATKHPELNLDIEYILNGNSHHQDEKRQIQYETIQQLASGTKIEQSQGTLIEIFPEPNNALFLVHLTHEETKLISDFRKSDEKHQKTILSVAEMARLSHS